MEPTVIYPPFFSKGELKGGFLYLGLKKNIKKVDFEAALKKAEDITKYLNFIEVKKGDFYYIPAGLIHTIGKGVKIFEPQQSSNITYRVYDYNRLDLDGIRRELHIEESLKAINFETDFNKVDKYKASRISNYLLSSKYFDVIEYEVKLKDNLEIKKQSKSYEYYFIVEGACRIIFDDCKKDFGVNDFFMIPYKTKSLNIRATGFGNLKIIRVLFN